MRLFYYIHEIANFGDDLSPVIVGKMLGTSVQTIQKKEIRKRYRREKFLFSLGSIFHFVHNGDVIWGTGVNIKRNNPKKLDKLDIRAVRGPLTRDFIIKNYDLHCPAVFGDPALLLPKLLPDLKRKPVRKYAIIPHGADNDHFSGYENVILPTAGWQNVLNYILGSELVISSGLHGLVLAEAFGVPARWLRHEGLPSYHSEGVFKYDDYFLSTERPPDDWAVSVEDAIHRGGKPPITVTFDSLANAFPRDVFSVQNRIVSSLERVFDRLILSLHR